MEMDKGKIQQIIQDYVIKRHGQNNSWIFDFRSILLNPTYLTAIVALLYKQIEQYERVQIGGMESASIPLVTGLILRAKQEGKDVTGFYIRKGRKKSGLYKQIEGELTDAPIVLIDDLINTGRSIQQQIAVLHDNGKHVTAVMTVVQFRKSDYYTELSEHKISLLHVFTLADFGLDLPDKKPVDQRPYETRWSFSPESVHHSLVLARSCPVIHTDTLFTGADDGYFYALNKTTGTCQWRIALGVKGPDKIILSTPAVAANTIFFGAYDGKVYAADLHTGEVRWIYSDCDWVGSSPALDTESGTVCIGLEFAHPTQKGSVVALDMHTGEKKWEYKLPALTHASPLIIPEHGMVCIGGNEGMLYAFNLYTGELLWRFETKGGQRYLGVGGFSPGDIKMAPVYDVATDTIACSCMDGYVYMIDRGTGACVRHMYTERNNTTARIGVYSSPIFTTKNIIFGALDKHVYCYDKRTGVAKWHVKTGGRIFATPVARAGIIYIGSNDGVVYEIDEQTGDTLARRQFSERIVCPVVFDDVKKRDMYVTTHGGVVHAVSQPQ